MSKGKIIILLVIAAVLVIGLFAAGALSYRKMEAEAARLGAELDKSEKRGKLLQRRYTEEKARADNLMRAKQAAEVRQRSAVGGHEEELKHLKAAFDNEKAALTGACDRKAKELEQGLEKLKAKADKLRASRDEVVERFKQKDAEFKEQKRLKTAADDHRRRAESDLKRVRQQYDNCREHNERLCLITEELVDKYKNKGVVGSIMVNEPFTQMRQVEVDRLVQEYTVKIDKEKID
ncbi:MAG: hypothetical protein ACOZF0_17595 [Thermodesulfobacteriota bacterium]